MDLHREYIVLNKTYDIYLDNKKVATITGLYEAHTYAEKLRREYYNLEVMLKEVTK